MHNYMVDVKTAEKELILKIVPIPANHLLYLRGSLHSLTDVGVSSMPYIYIIYLDPPHYASVCKAVCTSMEITVCLYYLI